MKMVRKFGVLVIGLNMITKVMPKTNRFFHVESVKRRGGGGYQKGLTYPLFVPYLISGHCKLLLSTVNGVNTESS